MNLVRGERAPMAPPFDGHQRTHIHTQVLKVNLKLPSFASPQTLAVDFAFHFRNEFLFVLFRRSQRNRCRYPSCSGARAPGLAADMHFRDDVIAFIGPACAFALEPVARLAAYWNSPIITGMGDQVSVHVHSFEMVYCSINLVRVVRIKRFYSEELCITLKAIRTHSRSENEL